MPTERRNILQMASDIIRDAGGEIVGRTRLQKTTCLLELAGFGDGFEFSYRYYGPFSEALASAARDASALGILDEVEYETGWGGWYSIYLAEGHSQHKLSAERAPLAKASANADAVELELAVTAAFLAARGESDPWTLTEKLKPAKAASGRLDKAKQLYETLRLIPVPKELPAI